MEPDIEETEQATADPAKKYPKLPNARANRIAHDIVGRILDGTLAGEPVGDISGMLQSANVKYGPDGVATVISYIRRIAATHYEQSL